MELLGKVLGLALLAALMSKPIEKSAPELSMLLVLAALLCGGALALSSGREALALAREIAALTKLSPELFSPLLKTVAIALTVRLGTAFCRDASHESLASLLETVGTLCALLASLPLVRAVVGLLEDFL